MKLIKGMVDLTCEDHLKIQRVHQVEAWIAEGTGLACTPYEKDLIVSLSTCKTWILTHIESGMTVGPAFPPDKHYARIWLEEIAREGLDFTQDRYAIKARIAIVERRLGIALKRAETRWAQVERDRKRQERQAQAQQLSLFGEV